MCQESPVHAGPEEKAMGRSGHHDAIPWEDYLSSGAEGSDYSKLRSPFSRSWCSAWSAQPQRLTWNQRYRHQCGSGCARPPHPWLHQLPSQITLPQSPKPWNVRWKEYQADRECWASRQQPAPAKRVKETKSKKNDNQRNQSVADVIKITSQTKVKLPWCSPAEGDMGPLGILLRWCHLRSACWMFFFRWWPSPGPWPPARTRFENLAPKYLYQDIFVNFFLVLISSHNRLLYPETPVLLPISGMSKTK